MTKSSSNEKAVTTQSPKLVLGLKRIPGAADSSDDGYQVTSGTDAAGIREDCDSGIEPLPETVEQLIQTGAGREKVKVTFEDRKCERAFEGSLICKTFKPSEGPAPLEDVLEDSSRFFLLYSQMLSKTILA